MRSVLNKDIIRDIKKSRGRFLSILCIVALGVAFFSGIKISPMVMERTSDSYYDDYNLMDIKLLSTLGLTDEDVKSVKQIEGVKGIFPTYSMDVLTKFNSQQFVLKVHGLPLEDIRKNSENYINQVNVVEGRLPEKSGECVVEKSKIGKFNVPIGSKIKLSSGNDDNLNDSLKNIEYTVVGKIETPYYLSHEKGSSAIGSGTIDSVVMIPQDDFKIDAYTEMFLTVDKAKEENSYKNSYFDKVDKVTSNLENISKERIEARYDQVISDANKELNEGKTEFNEKKKEVDTKLAQAQNDITKFENQISTGEKELKDNKIKVSNAIASGKKQIAKGEKQLEDGYKQYDKGIKSFNENKVTVQNGFKEAEAKLNDLNSKINNLQIQNQSLEEKLKNENLSEEEINQLTQQLSQNKEVINSMKVSYDQGSSELDSKKQDFKNTENALIKTKATLDSSKDKLIKEKANLALMEKRSKEEFKKATNEIESGKIEIKKAKIELQTSKVDATDELDKAENKIKDSEDEIKKIEKPEWYILDRNSHYSYAEYASCANSIDALSKIFPVFFFSVAALVCLTTMTRMVDEQRINIGTLKALGYTKGKIAKKYILYALTASLTGSVIGIAIGFTVFPIIVFNAYGIMYTMPEVQLLFDLPLAIGVTMTAVLITTLAAYLACHNELKETPSVLMRPRPPKNGKRILIERIPFIWNKIGFIGKVTIRNIFRYKKRFLMTVLGISGCTALILSGLGIQDSIQMIVNGQYGSIFKYDMTITIDNNTKKSDIDNIEKYVLKEKLITDYQFMNNQNGKVLSDGKEKQVTIMIPKDTEKMKRFIGLQDRKTQKNIELDNDGVVVSEKVARDFGLEKGDTIELLNTKEQKVKAKIIGVTENYVSHYVYMSKDYYKKLYKRDINYNRIIGMVSDKSIESENKLSKRLIDEPNVTGVGFNTGVKENFENTIKSLNYVVLIMTLSAGALAFVVLYNLTNVNISERIREIATIKVLGFYDNEVSAYVYRENIILTLIGTLVGLGLGKLLHQFIMVTVEIESMMFGRIIESSSYVIAAILTIILGLIVNFAMYYKLKNVEMVESLKSAD